MLPGETVCHLLMATLLENDPEALSRLGPMANFCGGFVYSGKSFWSTACIVGRVLAAGKGAVECMGWISSVITPQGLGDGWVDVRAEKTAGKLAHAHARIGWRWSKTDVGTQRMHFRLTRKLVSGAKKRLKRSPMSSGMQILHLFFRLTSSSRLRISTGTKRRPS
jgi:hypothetical protein